MDLTSVYTYTADGLRVQQGVDGTVTTFAWDWATPVPELLTDGDKRYLVGHDTLGWEDAVGWTYAVPDALGSVRQAVDGAGDLVESREWSPYGVEVGDAQPGLGYTGEWWDAAVGLQYLRARWYDSWTGTFVARDPVQSEPPYQYVRCSPVNGVDPSGAMPVWWEVGRNYMYSCKCGWIDLKHATSKRRWIERILDINETNGWQAFDYSSGAGGFGNRLWSTIDATFEVHGRLGDRERDEVALGTYIAWENFWEDFQGAHAALEVAQSSYSSEDLVSDLIGFHRGYKETFEGMSEDNSLQHFMKACDVVGYEELYHSDPQQFLKVQKRIYREYIGGNGFLGAGLKEEHWGVRPPYYWIGKTEIVSKQYGMCKSIGCLERNKELPSDLLSITPQPPGQNWRWVSGSWTHSTTDSFPSIVSHQLFDAEELNQRPLNWGR